MTERPARILIIEDDPDVAAFERRLAELKITIGAAVTQADRYFNHPARDFAKTDESARVAALKKIESSEFFQTVRLKTLQVLYATPMAYAYFGYEGEAFSRGGYLSRGFNDLRWLPEVPLEDSGPVPA